MLYMSRLILKLSSLNRKIALMFLQKGSSNTKVDIIKPKPTDSKRAFKEKQQTLFVDSNNKLPLIEFLEKHNSEIINHDEDSLKLMSEMLEQNLKSLWSKRQGKRYREARTNRYTLK